jgi:NAD(P)H-hydrate epimerase
MGGMLNSSVALLSVAQMGEADRLTVASGISEMQLMGNAGRAVAQATMERWSPRPVLVLCGPGNNGGDGFVAALCLAQHGWPVRVASLVPRQQLRGAAAQHAALWLGPVEALAPAALDGAALVVDALFGAGLSRPLEGAAAQTLVAAALRNTTLIAVDVPSGLMGDTGANAGAVPCALTVTCFRKKPGHLLQPGRSLCGELVVADIGSPASVFNGVWPDTFENDPLLWAAALPLLHPQGNKYTRGHALVWGGWPTTGAARMAARAAARVGAGLTTVAVDVSRSEAALPVYAAALISTMVSPVAVPRDLDKLLADGRITGLLIGPGAGAGPDTRARVLAMLHATRATVLDADALSAFKNEPSLLFRAINGPCVLTPHEGEFARLFAGISPGAVDAPTDKLARTRAAARASGAVVVLKGSDTVIAAPDGRAIVNANAPPNLATAGSGDVLAGMVLGLLAQGMEPFLAAAAAVWLHGAAAAHFGPGLLAEDLPDQLPAVYRQLAKGASFHEPNLPR